MARNVTIAAAVSALLLISAISTRVMAQESTRRDLYKYIWDFIIVGDGEATKRDLQNIGKYFSGIDQDTQTKVEQTFRAAAMSEREKRNTMLNHLAHVRYGTVSTKSGETYTGVLAFKVNTHRSEFQFQPDIMVYLTKGGQVSAPWRKIKQISFGDKECIVQTNDGQNLHGMLQNFYCYVTNGGIQPVRLEQRELQRAVFGNLKSIQCPNCFRVMEIDWKFCPYDGTKLTE